MCQICYVMAVWKWFYYKLYIFYMITKRADNCNENNQCHMTWAQCLSRVSELPSHENNEIEEINVLPKSIFHAPLLGD